MKRVWFWDKEVNRVWVGGYRVHHGAIGFFLCLVGAWLMRHDWLDKRVWLKLEKLVP